MSKVKVGQVVKVARRGPLEDLLLRQLGNFQKALKESENSNNVLVGPRPRPDGKYDVPYARKDGSIYWRIVEF